MKCQLWPSSGSDFFKDTGVKNLSDLDQYTPSLQITQGTDPSVVSIRIRGIGSVGSNVGIDPSVGVFIDGVYQGRAGMSIGDLVDIERVEILRGPQGTLYGKNTAAGAISIITMAPSPEAVEAEVELTYDSDQRAEIHAMGNVPLGDEGHAMRLTGYVVNGDHLYDNQFTGEGANDVKKWGVKSRFLFDTEAASEGDGFGEFLFTLDYSKEDDDCCALAVSDYDGFSTLNAPSTNNPSQAFQEALGLNALGNPIYEYIAFEDTEGFSPPKADPFDENNYWFDAPISNKIEVGGVAAEWNKELSNEHVLTFINAWRHYEADNERDGDFTAYDAVTATDSTDFDQYSSELRITSPGGETFDYQGGLYYFYSKLNSEGELAQTSTLADNVPLYGGFFPNGSSNTDLNKYETTSYAAFGQVVWNMTDDFSATLGLRFTNEQKDRKGSQITTPTSPLDLPPIAGPDVFYDETRSDSNISPAFNLRYFVTPEIMTYASISRGFKSGGFNQRREVATSSGEFDEETATNYELGWKGSTEDRRLQFIGTFYFVDYEDFQSENFDGTTLAVKNAGSMESYGTELELIFVPAAGITASTAIGYNKAEYKEFKNAQCTVNQVVTNYYIEGGAQGGFPVGSCTQDLKGVQIENAPEWTVSSFVQYETDLPSDLIGRARLEHSYIDDYFLDQDQDPNLVNDSVHLVNLRLTVTNPENTWDASIWGRNLLDEEYYAVGFDIPVLGGYAAVAAPGAVYGVTVSFRH
jgi:iron complex outermembrane receptor protein